MEILTYSVNLLYIITQVAHVLYNYNYISVNMPTACTVGMEISQKGFLRKTIFEYLLKTVILTQFQFITILRFKYYVCSFVPIDNSV